MMWAEFEKLAGFEVSHDVYHNVIEPMYNALPESYTKQDFIRMLNPAAFKCQSDVKSSIAGRDPSGSGCAVNAVTSAISAGTVVSAGRR